MKKISVIIPVYNTEKYLKKCLDSLVNQVYRDFTAILVNDGSTDGSYDILCDYERKYPEIFKVYNIENSGRANARNYGLKKVRTEYFTFLDSDDYIDEAMLWDLISAMNKNVDVVACDCARIVDGVEKGVIKNFNDNIEDLSKALMLSNPGPHSKLYRTSIFIENNLEFPKNVKLYEDLGLMPLVGLYTNKIVYIQKPLYKYVIHEGSALRQDTLNDNMYDIFTIMNILKEKIPSEYSEELEYLYIEHLLRSASLRYINYPNGEHYVQKISDIMHKEYPNYQNNKYYKNVNYRFKLVCSLAYHKNYLLLKMFNKLNNIKTNI